MWTQKQLLSAPYLPSPTQFSRFQIENHHLLPVIERNSSVTHKSVPKVRQNLSPLPACIVSHKLPRRDAFRVYTCRMSDVNYSVTFEIWCGSIVGKITLQWEPNFLKMFCVNLKNLLFLRIYLQFRNFLCENVCTTLSGGSLLLLTWYTMCVVQWKKHPSWVGKAPSSVYCVRVGHWYVMHSRCPTLCALRGGGKATQYDDTACQGPAKVSSSHYHQCTRQGDKSCTLRIIIIIIQADRVGFYWSDFTVPGEMN